MLKYGKKFVHKSEKYDGFGDDDSHIATGVIHNYKYLELGIGEGVFLCKGHHGGSAAN
jgi:hypothetical protein